MTDTLLPLDPAFADTDLDTTVLDAVTTVGTVGRTWTLDPDRYALAVSYRLGGMTLWRARLRVLDATVTAVSSPGRHSADGSPDTLKACVAARPLRVAVPGSRGAFLPATARDAQLQLSATVDPAGGGLATADVLVQSPDERWHTTLTLRRTELPDDRLLVVAQGAIPRRPDAPLPSVPVLVEFAGEFLRCA